MEEKTKKSTTEKKMKKNSKARMKRNTNFKKVKTPKFPKRREKKSKETPKKKLQLKNHLMMMRTLNLMLTSVSSSKSARCFSTTLTVRESSNVLIFRKDLCPYYIHVMTNDIA
jgi:hypothetical protein